jgi:acetylornithine aminotransferase
MKTSAYLGSQLEVLPKLFPGILHPTIRGRGLIVGLGFKDEKGPGRVVEMAREHGVLLLTAGHDAVRLVPSLIIGKEEVDIAVEVIKECLQEL